MDALVRSACDGDDDDGFGSSLGGGGEDAGAKKRKWLSFSEFVGVLDRVSGTIQSSSSSGGGGGDDDAGDGRDHGEGGGGGGGGGGTPTTATDDCCEVAFVCDIEETLPSARHGGGRGLGAPPASAQAGANDLNQQCGGAPHIG